MSDTTALPVPTDKLVSVYIKMRDKRASIKAAYEEEDGKIKRQMEIVENELLKICKAAGADSLKTAHGNVIRSIRTNYWTSDWEEMHNFIKETGDLGLLERRIAQKAMGEFLKSHPDKMPKGLNVDSKYTVVVRRS